jgi:hypothetical protein
MCRIVRFRITKDSHQADFDFFLGQLIFHQSCYQEKLIRDFLKADLHFAGRM